MQNNMADNNPEGQVLISQLLAQGNESMYGQEQLMNPFPLSNTSHVNHVNVANISPVPFSLAIMPFYNQIQDPLQSTSLTMSAPTTHSPQAWSKHSWYTIFYATIAEHMRTKSNPATLSNQSSSPQTSTTIQLALEVIFSTINILNSRFYNFKNEAASRFAKLDILETSNNRMETIDKCLSNL